MVVEKSCRTCSDNNNCCFYDKIEYDPVAAVEYVLEDGVINDILQEELDLIPLLEELQSKGIVRKNVNIKSVDMNDCKIILMEQLSNRIWDYIIGRIAGIEVTRTKMTDSEFHCSEWR